jgi:hypothetical protein
MRAAIYLLSGILCLAVLVLSVASTARARVDTSRIGLLVVSVRKDLPMESRAQSIVNRLVAWRNGAGVSEKDMPVLMYHYDLPREAKYCREHLSIQASDLLFVGVVEEHGYVADRVLFRTHEPGVQAAWQEARRRAAPLFAAPPPREDTILCSDSFERADSDVCTLGMTDNRFGGVRTYGYIPIFPGGGTDVTHPVGAYLADHCLCNSGRDFGGVQLANASGCTLFSEFGVAAPQDVDMQAEFLVPRNGSAMTTAGFYARSRSANVGDGIIGGDSSGYWVRLWSDGHVDVFNLHSTGGPNPFARSAPVAGFRDQAFHKLRMSLQAETVRVRLDSHAVRFDGEAGELATLPPSAGSNHGTAGLAFAAEPRGAAGGQRVRHLVIRTRW